MYAEQELSDLVAMARAHGANIDVTFDEAIRKAEGFELIETVTVHSGIPGIGPHPMGGFFACEALRKAKALGNLGPVIQGIFLREIERGQLRVSAKMSSGDLIPLFNHPRADFSMDEAAFLGKTKEEAIRIAPRGATILVVQPRPSTAAPTIAIERGVGEDDQVGSFQNATFQTAGERVAFSIATTIAVPDEISDKGEEAVTEFIHRVLAPSARAGAKFDVQIGPSEQAQREADRQRDS